MEKKKNIKKIKEYKEGEKPLNVFKSIVKKEKVKK